MKFIFFFQNFDLVFIFKPEQVVNCPSRSKLFVNEQIGTLYAFKTQPVIFLPSYIYHGAH
jgi:hypothetical protein